MSEQVCTECGAEITGRYKRPDGSNNLRFECGSVAKEGGEQFGTYGEGCTRYQLQQAQELIKVLRGHKFFAYSPDEGLDFFDTVEEAKAGAEKYLDWMKDYMDGEWPEEADQIFYGIVLGGSTETLNQTACEFHECDDDCDGNHEHDFYVDYEIQEETK